MRRIAAVAAVAGVCLLAGCNGEGSATDTDTILNDLTPELFTITERHDDAHANRHVTHNHNMRAFWDDLGRVFLTDHPSRLSPYPVIDPSGQPR